MKFVVDDDDDDLFIEDTFLHSPRSSTYDDSSPSVLLCVVFELFLLFLAKDF